MALGRGGLAAARHARSRPARDGPGVGRRERVQPLVDRDIDALMTRTRHAPGGGGRISPRDASSTRLLLAIAGGRPARPAGRTGWRRRWRCRRRPLLRRRLHDLAQAPDAAEHRHRRRGRRGPAAGRLGRRDRAASSRSRGLFVIIFLWTPPHFWALAHAARDDYERAGVPMLPIVAGARATARADRASTPSLLALPRWCRSRSACSAGSTRWRAVVLGARFLQLAVRLLRAAGDRPAARRVFLFSLVYLARCSWPWASTARCWVWLRRA